MMNVSHLIVPRCQAAAAGSLSRWACAAALWLGLCLNGAAQADATNRASSTVELVAQLQGRLTVARATLGRTVAESEAGALPPGATPAETDEARIIAEVLVRIYEDHVDVAKRLEELQRSQVDREQMAASWTGFSEPPPYSILLADELRGSLQSLGAKISATAAALNLLSEIRDDNEKNLSESDKQLRLLAEQLESSPESALAARLTWQRALEQLRNQQLAASLALGETRRRKLEVELAQDRLQQTFVRRQLTVVNQQLRFSHDDLAHVLAGLDGERRAVEKEIAGAESERAVRQRELEEAREELRRVLQKVSADPASQVEHDSNTEVGRLRTRIELKGVQAETVSQRLTVLRRLGEVNVAERGLWQMRFAVFHTKSLDDIHDSYQRLVKLDRMIRSAKPYFRQQVEVAAGQIADQRNRLRNAPDGQPASAEATALLECCRQQEELANRALLSVDRVERLATRWREALDEDRQRLPLTSRLSDLFGSFSSFSAKLWKFEIFAAQDTITVDGQTITGRRSVTIGKVVIEVLILVVGYWLAILISRLLERLALRYFRVEPLRASFIRRGVRTALLVCLLVFSLVSVKIPLTIFAFLGGALAIGLGFGTQNLLKNFISGIIILFERPFRIGDVLDIDGKRGKVINIGIRSSVIRLYDGKETLIPNSALLENNLTNWTYSDRKVRYSFSIGVAYGADTRLVAQLLSEEAGRHGLVLKDPPPQVLFVDFGDSAMTFELRYWVDVHRHDGNQIGSDLRHMIITAFNQNGIAMPFPQRDLHFDPKTPLQVQVVQAEDAGVPAPAAGEAG